MLYFIFVVICIFLCFCRLMEQENLLLCLKMKVWDCWMMLRKEWIQLNKVFYWKNINFYTIVNMTIY